MLIDNTYFVLDIAIPSSTYSSLDAEIAKYEKEILQRCFGYELWKLIDEGSTDTRITDLVNGKEYEVNGSIIKWNGLINEDKVSLIAYYVYYWHTRNLASTLQTTGVMKLQSENAEAGNQSIKMVSAWNRLYELYGSDEESIYDPSAYNFMSAHSGDYPEWIFKPIYDMNQYGI